jgi:uncharacterized repeat protein (TIGR02543 family)
MPSEPGKSGYIFGGWYTATGGGGTQFTDSTMVTGNITVYAQWTTVQYTVTFDADGGSPATQTKTVNSGASVGASDMPSEPGKSGSIFGGWYTATGGGGTQFTASTVVSGSVTVYAWWAAGIITLNLDAGGGAFSESSFSISKTGAPQTKTIAIIGSGYSNPRWYVDGVLQSTQTSITIDAAHYGLGGGHSVSLLIIRNGVAWSKDVAFTGTG